MAQHRRLLLGRICAQLGRLVGLPSRQGAHPSIPRWAEVLANSARERLDTACALLVGVNDAFGTQCPWESCSRLKADGYLCPLADFTQSGMVTIADHLRSYWHLMGTATPALALLTVLRATVETAASVGWAWAPDDWEGRHLRALRSIQRDVVTFTAGGSVDPRHRYPTERSGLDPNTVLTLLHLPARGAAPKRTALMRETDAEHLYAVLSGAAHGSREVVGLVVQDSPEGGQVVLPHALLTELTWRDADKILQATFSRLQQELSRQI